jgi:hypothetical protein
LALIKEQLPRGEFLPYIEREFGMSDKLAEHFMNVAAEFGDKIEIVSSLPVTALYALAAPSAVESGASELVQQQVAEGTTPPTAKDIKAAVAETMRALRASREAEALKQTEERVRRAMAGEQQAGEDKTEYTASAERRAAWEQSIQMLNEDEPRSVGILAGSVDESAEEHALYLYAHVDPAGRWGLDADTLRRAATRLSAWADLVQRDGDEGRMKDEVAVLKRKLRDECLRQVLNGDDGGMLVLMDEYNRLTGRTDEAPVAAQSAAS